MAKRNPIETYFDQLAPSWDSFGEKHPGEVDFLLRQIGIQGGELVADVACGTGVITAKLHAYSKAPIVGIDLSAEMIALAQKKYASCPWAHFVREDFLLAPEKRAFDVVVVYNAYPHFLEPGKLSEALNRALKSGGRFAIVHSLSREELHRHHEGLDAKLSRDLLPVREEAKFFEKDFRILKAEEGPDSFLILGAKIG